MLCGPPIFLSDRYIDLPLTFDEVAAVAALAPPEIKRERRHKQQKTSNVEERARKYLERKDLAISGQHGSDRTFDAACVLVLGYDMSPEEAFPLLQEYNDRLDEKWTEAELEHKLKGANERPGERGYLKDNNSHLMRDVIPFDYSLNTFEPYEPPVTTIILPPIDDCPLIDPMDGHKQPHPIIESPPQEILPELNTVPMQWDDPKLQDGRNDVANGKRLARIIHNKAYYIEAWDSWVAWDGRRWKQDNLGIREFAKRVAGTIIADAVKGGPPDETAIMFAMKSLNRGPIDSMIYMAKSEPGVPIDHTLLDVDPFLLNCPNGTVDLRTGELRPHNHMDMITRMTPVHYDPDAESYEWDKFLEKILVEQPLIDHVQRLMGYCITGSVREQVLPIFWGKGSNGKSTLLNLIKAAVGMDYASEAPDSLLAKKKNESHPTEVATLLGQRLVTTIETEEGQRLNEPLVKKLTGGDTIKTRRMRENPWEFKPTHKIILCTNHEPRVGNDDAIWRRLIMVPFVVKFWNPAKGETGPPELERDNELEDRLKACLPGILAWCVRGAVEWYKNGLSNPEIVQAATTKYQERQDTFGKFVEERCCTGEQYRVRFSDLYSHFEGWAKEIGERMLSRRAVGSWLESHGYQGVSSNGRWYIGITGKPEYDKTNTFEDTEWNDGTK